MRNLAMLITVALALLLAGVWAWNAEATTLSRRGNRSTGNELLADREGGLLAAGNAG